MATSCARWQAPQRVIAVAVELPTQDGVDRLLALGRVPDPPHARLCVVRSEHLSRLVLLTSLSTKAEPPTLKESGCLNQKRKTLVPSTHCESSPRTPHGRPHGCSNVSRCQLGRRDGRRVRGGRPAENPMVTSSRLRYAIGPIGTSCFRYRGARVWRPGCRLKGGSLLCLQGAVCKVQSAPYRRTNTLSSANSPEM